MKRKSFGLILIFTVISFSLSAQSDSLFLKHAAQSLSAYFDARPVEKVYLHLDRDRYQPGDTIWFKAYLVAGPDHVLSGLSGVLYAELLDKNDSLLSRLNLQVNNGLAAGDFGLPEDCAPGYYHIRAYTNWMRNEPADYFYNQQIQIGFSADIMPQTSPQAGLISVPPSKQKPTGSHIDVQFFPEGGYLVNGLRSKVAVKAVNRFGLGEDISGEIIDNDNAVVANFSTLHLGMGAFAILPAQGKSYRARVWARDSAVFVFGLPTARESGFTLTLNAVGTDSIRLKIAANDALFKLQKDSTFYVIAQQNGAIGYTAAAKLTAPVFTAGIPQNRFKTGIVQFTLFSSSGEALNERVIFVQHNDMLKLGLKADTVSQPWHKMAVTLGAKTISDQPAAGSFSISVTDDSKQPADETEHSTIFTHLLLSSDLKGYIENPAYYFTNVNDTTRADLDLLMLTQGYRKLVWRQVLDGGKPVILHRPERSLELEGMVMTPSGTPVINGKVSITSIADRLVIDTITNDDGSFRFTNLQFPDTARILVKATKANKGRNVTIYLKQHDYPAADKNLTREQQAAAFATLTARQEYVQAVSATPQDTSTQTHQLKQVIINAQKTPKPDIYNNYGTNYEYEVNLGQLKDFFNLKEAIAHKIPGVSTNIKGKLSYDGAYLAVFINGLQREQDDLNIYDLADIESIRLIDGHSPSLIVTTHPFTARDSIHIKLKEVKINAKKAEKPGKANHFGTDAPYTISADRLKDMGPELSPGYISKIPGAMYQNGVIVSMHLPHPPLHIVLNDHEIPAGDDINNYVTTDDVENIKILQGTYYKSLYGITYNPKNQDQDDIVLITTKEFAGTATAERLKLKEISLKNDANAKYITTQLPTGLISYHFNGYYKAREFYSPKYDDPKTPKMYDPRITSYWNPEIITDKDGNAGFEFYNNGNKGIYKVIIEGVDAAGNLGRVVYYYTVR